MKHEKIIILAIGILFLNLVNADSTFYDNPNEFFMMGNPQSVSSATDGVSGSISGESFGRRFFDSNGNDSENFAGDGSSDFPKENGDSSSEEKRINYFLFFAIMILLCIVIAEFYRRKRR